jgi:DMSO/TMAO reductase YedYZ molybdopterin-dependent catalytic subunit
VGVAVALGVTELIHGLYQPVPSVLLAVAQWVVRLTPGGFATSAIETLGKADIPVLISSVVVGALLFGALLANLGLRSPAAALAGVGVLGALGIAAALSEPLVAPVATVITAVGALGSGVAVAGFLLRASDLPSSSTEEAGGEPRVAGVRSREAHSTGGIAVGRRNFLLLSGGAAAAGLAAAGAGRLLAGGEAGGTSAAAPRELPRPSSSGGQTISRETLPPPPESASIEAPGMPPLITPSKDFYLIDTALSSPRVDADTWSLKVGGAVDNPIEIPYEDLISLPTIEADITLSCVSNEVGGGLVSNGRWTGVRLSDVLEEAGIGPDKIDRASEQLVSRSVDGWTAGFRTDVAFDGREALVAFGLNGSELPVKHGYPVRLVVPGLYGYVSATKWLTEIELADRGFDAYWIQRGWSREGPVKTQSRIDTVEPGEELRAGRVPIGGVAWAPTRGIERVEVSTDGGETWNDARLATQLDVDAWRQYVYDWEAGPGEYTLQVRATDGNGETQTGEQTPPHPSGATGYHTIEVTVA